MKTVGVFVFSFVFALNLQGIFAAVSPTSGGYFDGVSKVVNHLSLGMIDLKGGESVGVSEGNVSGEAALKEADNPVENVVEKTVENSDADKEKNEPVFGGYVAESTDTRVRLSRAALDIWKKDFKTVVIGVGIGGAGQALFDNGLSPAPKEIVQNEYASLLLETGLIGVSLFVVMLILAIRVAFKNCGISGMILALLVVYGVSLFFFSGLPNALHVVLLPGLLMNLRGKDW